jgi:hypothetical protein
MKLTRDVEISLYGLTRGFLRLILVPINHVMRARTHRVQIRRLIMKPTLLIPVLFAGMSCSKLQYPEFEPSSDIVNYDQYDQTRLPILFDAGVYPYIEITVQGKVLKLHVDTGDEVSNLSLTSSQMSGLTFEYTDMEYKTSDMQGKTVVKNFFELRDVQIGDYVLEKVLCTESLQRPAPYLMDVGVIGWHLLKKFSPLIDYRNGAITLYKQGHFPEDVNLPNWNTIVLNFEPPLTFSAQIQNYNRVLQLGMDTGSLMVGSSADNCGVENWIRIEIPQNILNQYSITHFMSNPDFPVINGVSVTSNGSVIENLDFLYYRTEQPANRDGFLGGDFFFKYRVFVDTPNGVLYYQSY